ncbi:MAG: L-seryl-tRNA(Sec) selenium transferase [Pyrinomonadaceae bacterium]|nr:L-seryl-tRNA(Sec) selenium transferase [Pyrinomonadaceae bacterium]
MQTKENNLTTLNLLPSVDVLLKTATAKSLIERIGTKSATEIVRKSIDDLRQNLRRDSETFANFSRQDFSQHIENKLESAFNDGQKHRFQKVVNATGVVVHTNLGRAPLSKKAQAAIAETASRYCTLEYNLETGKRGKRGSEAESAFCKITNAESCLIVNNCAAAAFLTLTALGANGETIVSRGELVEIGGDFRVPDILRQSNSKLVEVGTTNRTKLRDFSEAITENTKLLLRVHPSNFRIVGFTEMPQMQDLANLAHEKNVILYEDAGSGALIDLSKFGLTDEPIIADSIKAGVDVVTFSADKLLGGCQAGIIVGKQNVVDKLRKHPLYRALRVDKIAYAALSATLESYMKDVHFDEIPVLKMIAMSFDTIQNRAENFISNFKSQASNYQDEKSDFGLWTLDFGLKEGISAIGGGSAPLTRLKTCLIALKHEKLSPDELEKSLRFHNPPIIARIENDNVLIDLRTVHESEEAEIIAALVKINNEN